MNKTIKTLKKKRKKNGCNNTIKKNYILQNQMNFNGTNFVRCII